MLDPIEAMRLMAGAKIRFVVIGGMAGRYWGSPTTTEDLDVCVSRESRSIERLVQFLNSVTARFRDAPDDLKVSWTFELIMQMEMLTLETELGPLDILFEPVGTTGFESLRERSIPETIEGQTVLFCALDDLIAMKEAADRAKDRIEVQILKAVREERSKS